MQFVAHGPDIPDSLLEAHEEGRVVFFCGAGVSYPAGLPGFSGLVDDIYKRIGTGLTEIEREAYQRGQFDATLDLLERRLPGKRIAVRQKLAEVLQPKWRRKGATDTHEALLELGRSRDGSLRLVTTNFDRIFERVGKRPGRGFHAYAAPMLPIPKNSRWNGLVYLHGLLPNKSDSTALSRLVLTSGDYGLAYLTERWAARFVSDLFRNYVVCFVGYSINDPVLRYMMDALASDRMLGEFTPQAYALGDCAPGQERAKRIEWEAKGVVPILYEVAAGSHDHSALHKTFKAWAETYRDGILGKERIVIDYALARPSASTLQDDFVGRLLWALSHESGLPAKRFAEFNPAPSLEWLSALSDERYLHSDLSRFGVPPSSAVDEKLRFSFVRRPASYRHAPWMALVLADPGGSQWDDVMFQLARWLVRHLNDPALVIWLARRGAHLHPRWARLIEQQLNLIAGLERDGKTADLDDIRSHAANAIPSTLMRTLWRLLLTERVKLPWQVRDLYGWKDRFVRDGLTTSLRLELRELLSPKIKLAEPFRWRAEDAGVDEPERIAQLVKAELVLSADHVHSSIGELFNERRRTLPVLLDDFQTLLRDALDLLHELGQASDKSDPSYWNLPSISPHWQNRGYRDWVILIELLRDSWLAIRETDAERARGIAIRWFNIPYPTFKRLALFAASYDGGIDGAQWVSWLMADAAWWLWSGDTKREVMRLFVRQAARLSPAACASLEDAILTGPPRDMYREDIQPEDWQSLVDGLVWLRLSKLRQGGATLSADAAQQLRKLSEANPSWRLFDNEQEEFSTWMSGTGDPDYEASRQVIIAPRTRRELVQWLKEPIAAESTPPFQEDTWRETCRTRFFHSCLALCDLAQENMWPAERWREALQVWSEEGQVERSWRYAARLVQAMPDDVLLQNAHSVTWWIEAVSKLGGPDEVILIDLCRRVLSLFRQPSETLDEAEATVKDPVTAAINHPIGHIAQALLNIWVRRKPSDNDDLPDDIRRYFTDICDIRNREFRHGRVLLASRLIALFRVDPNWTATKLLPLLDWETHPIEARSAWEGFLWSPRLYRPLMAAFKSQFLDTAHHYDELRDVGRQYAALLTYAALDLTDGYTAANFQTAISALPQSGLQEIAQTLEQALEGAGEQREDYWKNRVQPFWKEVWPKSIDVASNRITEWLVRVCIAARGEFPSALTTLESWLGPVEYPHFVVHKLNQSGLSARFPEAALSLLDAIVADQPAGAEKLAKCLADIAEAMPRLRQDHRYKRLTEYARRHEH